MATADLGAMELCDFESFSPLIDLRKAYAKKLVKSVLKSSEKVKNNIYSGKQTARTARARPPLQAGWGIRAGTLLHGARAQCRA